MYEFTNLQPSMVGDALFLQIKRVNTLLTPLPLESTYVVYIHNATMLSDPFPVLTFHHTDIIKGYFRRSTVDVIEMAEEQELAFEMTSDGLVHGFVGYFDSKVILLSAHDVQLSETVEMSIVPRTHSMNLVSWFPLFIPIDTPLQGCE